MSTPEQLLRATLISIGTLPFEQPSSASSAPTGSASTAVVDWLMSGHDQTWHAFTDDQLVIPEARMFLRAMCGHSVPHALIGHTPPVGLDRMCPPCVQIAGVSTPAGTQSRNADSPEWNTRMHAKMFTLFSAEDPSRVFAFGLEIFQPDGSLEEAVIFRRDPVSGASLVGTHRSAEAAQARYSMITPLTLVREEDADEDVRSISAEPQPKLIACTGRPRYRR